MNYYERIQKSINFMEDNLQNEICAADIAKEAYMSVSNFYRLFFAIIGIGAKEYLISRRISKAAEDLKAAGSKVIDVALKYSYESPDGFSRIFKRITGFTPSNYSKKIYNFKFERINVMEKYFEEEESEMLEKYPEIKIMNELGDMRVAYYCYYGKNPENGAFCVLQEWVLKNKLDIDNGGYRIFGYNAPDSDPAADEYGYEVCVTIPNDFQFQDEKVRTKTLKGGLYAVVSIEPADDLGEEIMKGWKRFMEWMEHSKYVYGESQWLEEHLGFDEKLEHLGGVDLYMPVKLKAEQETEIDGQGIYEENIAPFTVATYTSHGKNAETTARKYLFSWIKEQKINLEDEDTRVFSYYNFEKIGKPDFFYKMCVKIPEGIEIRDDKIAKEPFSGGLYLTKKVPYRINGQSWFNFIRKIESSNKYGFDSQPFMEEYLIGKPVINTETEVLQHMPISVK
ncbi:MAG TPA: effector binding domain-containing protein [Lachnospiraceae bacterium]|nr:effector binding domain-containing protein [Lachnospiraceae bacterium]